MSADTRVRGGLADHLVGSPSSDKVEELTSIPAVALEEEVILTPLQERPSSHPDARYGYAEEPLLMPVQAPSAERPPAPEVAGGPMPIPGAQCGIIPAIPPHSTGPSLKWLSGNWLSLAIEPGPPQLAQVRVGIALGLIALVSLIAFVAAMGWEIPIAVFSVLLMVSGLGAAVVGGMARSFRDILLGCVATVAAFSTPVFGAAISRAEDMLSFHSFGYHGIGAIRFLFSVLHGLADVAFELVAGLAVLAILPLLTREKNGVRLRGSQPRASVAGGA